MNSKIRKHYRLDDVVELTGIEHNTVLLFVRLQWIAPVAQDEFDQEDIARIHLIEELRQRFGANDEAIPVILHLMDQVYWLRHQIKEKEGRKDL